MRITLPSGTPATIATAVEPSMGLVVATDIWGIRPLYDDLVARLAAEWGMTVCAVEPFPGEDLPQEMAPRVEAITRADDRSTLRDLVEAADRTECDRVGLIGFCMGGMSVFRATSLERFARLVAFYGMIRPPAAWAGPGQRPPLDLIRSGHRDRLLAVIGEVDPFTPPDDVAELESRGVATARDPEAAHAFVHDPARDSYRAADAADAWRRCEEWLRSS